MTTGTAMAPARTTRPTAWNDPFRMFRTNGTRLFEEPFNLFRTMLPFTEETLPLTTWTPLCDIFETEKEIVVRAELPGMRREDLHVTVENNTLTLRGERKFEEETARENYHRVERAYGEFMRSFTLPTTVDATRINATFTDGLLTLHLPKRAEALPKQIEIKVTTNGKH